MKALADFMVFMNAGGLINWIIAGLYLGVLGTASARGAYFWRTRRGRRTVEAIAAGSAGDAPGSSQAERIARCYRANQARPQAALEEIIGRQGAEISSEMEQGAGILSFTGTVAPLLGLLGTITGLMRAFTRIESLGGNVDIAALSGGIREAMITTATGLVTAITAAALAKLFDSLAETRAREMSFAVSLLAEQRNAL
jgi:biopolymer transport protein ExbB